MVRREGLAEGGAHPDGLGLKIRFFTRACWRCRRSSPPTDPAQRRASPRTGFIIGWLYLLLTLLISPLLILILSSVMSAATHSENLWWVWALVATAVVVMVNVQGAQASSRLNVILGGIEVGIFAVLSVWLIIKAGNHNTLQMLGTTFATVPGQTGISGIIAGAAYCVLAFSGFEAAAPMAEETRDARRAIPRAVLGFDGHLPPGDGRPDRENWLDDPGRHLRRRLPHLRRPDRRSGNDSISHTARPT